MHFYNPLSMLKGNLVGVVEASNKLCSKTLSLKTDQLLLGLATKPAHTKLFPRSGKIWKIDLLHKRPSLLFDLFTQVGLVSKVFSRSKVTKGLEAVATSRSSSATC